MTAASVDADFLFRSFTACPTDPKTLVLDVRNNKDFKKGHVMHAYNIRLSSNGRVLLDYSKASYDVNFTQDCWWGKPVLIYGDAQLKKDHPVIDYLAKQGKCGSLSYFKDGYEAFEKKYPFLCTQTVKFNSSRKYPSQLIPGLLYLGDWTNAEAMERLTELNIKRIITIHNHPANLKPPTSMSHLKFEMPDVDTADISKHFGAAYEFIEEGRARGQAVLVHCGAGVSRSSTLCMMYLMRRNLWSAQQALDFVKERRSLTCPNDGFWRTLCALEGSLGITKRSDPNATSGFHGADAPAMLSEDAVGPAVSVKMITARELKQKREQQAKEQQQREEEDAVRASKRQRTEAGEPGNEARGDRADVAHGDRHRGSNGDGDRRHRRRADDEDDRSRRHEARRHDERREREGSDWDHEPRDNGRKANRSDSGRHRDERPHRQEGRADDVRKGELTAGNKAVVGERDARRRSRSPPASAAGDARGLSPADAAAAASPVAANSLAAVAPGKAGSSGVTITLEVSKPEGLMGQLVVGPMQLHQRCVIGRAPSCDVVVEHQSVSRMHAQLTVDISGAVYVTDLGSGHGTKLGDTWLKANVPRLLTVGAVLMLGASTRKYQVLLLDST